jgi:pimeloyl-ACP methyl ester carboxylesterase
MPDEHIIDGLDADFLITADELTLRCLQPMPVPRLAFKEAGLPFDQWRDCCRAKLAELLPVREVGSCRVHELRRTMQGSVRVTALTMEVNADLSIPGYLLEGDGTPRGTVVAIHGHGEVDPCLGLWDDYHHSFALALAQAGFRVLLPELRGFGALFNVAHGLEGYRLDYWRWGTVTAYTMVIDGFLYGQSLLGATTEDLLRWENWLVRTAAPRPLSVAGISYGGDLALAYAAFSANVERIFASGTLGSFSAVFARCYNAPAHCVPGILQWMDRADIAGLCAPRPMALHFGELDVPGPDNNSASYNETVPPALADLRQIYAAAGAENRVELIVSPGKRHELDLPVLEAFLGRGH